MRHAHPPWPSSSIKQTPLSHTCHATLAIIEISHSASLIHCNSYQQQSAKAQNNDSDDGGGEDANATHSRMYVCTWKRKHAHSLMLIPPLSYRTYSIIRARARVLSIAGPASHPKTLKSTPFPHLR